jgi:hypothetical protein
MIPSKKKFRRGSEVDDDYDRGFPWLEGALTVSCLALFFQLFPGALSSVAALVALSFSYVDVRGWTWRSYAVICTVIICVLIVAKNWQDNA